MTKPFVRPDVQAFLDLMKANPRPALSVEISDQLRAQANYGLAMLDLPVGELAVMRDLVTPGPGGDIGLRLFDARAARAPGPAVVFFHGGGHTFGDIDSHASICAEIARQLDLPVISVAYRLAPENPWPAAPDDAEAAARWVAANAQAFDRSVTGLVLFGDSAGGNLALVTGLTLRDRPADVPVVLQVVLYPGTDLLGHYPSTDLFGEGYQLDAVQIRWLRDQYKPDGQNWRASPIHAELAGSPPTVLVTAALDPQRDQGRAYAVKLVQAGVSTTYREAPGTIHGFATHRRAIPSGQDDLLGVLAQVRAMLAERGGG